jgi:hypothetical protein
LVNSRVARFKRSGLRYLALSHRWAGVGLCVLFALWFASGAVLHFVPYPALSHSERIGSSARIELSRVRFAPADAVALVPGAESLRLVGIQGRPVYVVSSVERPVVVVSAETGERLGILSSVEAGRIARDFQGANIVQVEGPLSYDQWTVAQDFDVFRPLYRVTLQDQAGTQLYVSARSGEVLQRTIASQRLWNWCGANIHWIYFSALRAHWVVWDRLVWWLALSGLLTSIAGVWLGLVRLAAHRRSGRSGLTPFRRWLAWHHRVGLFAGAFVIAWIFSGWLSMDHGRLFSTGAPKIAQVSRLQDEPLQSIASAISVSEIQAADPVSEILVGAVAGHGFMVARGLHLPARFFRLDAPNATHPTTGIPDSWLLAGVHAVWPDQPVVDRGTAGPDDLYTMAEYIPAGTRVIRVDGRKPIDVYIDPDSGCILSVMDVSRRAYAWVFYALHTFKFPGLATHPELRHFVVLVPLMAGFAFSVTGIAVAISRLRASF